MDPMMMAIIAVVVLVLIAGAFFFMKSRGDNAANAPSASANRPKTLAEQQREMEQQRLTNPVTPAAPSAPAVDPLTTAQQYIQHQDFGQAITTLKNAIQQDGQRSALYLPLLNIFAQQKNLVEFNQYLNPLLALNDPTATSQAMSLKKLLDDEMAFEAQPISATQTAPIQAQTMSVPTPVATTQPESLDFDGFDFDNTASTPAAQPVMATPTTSTSIPQVEDSLSFDDIEFPTIASSASVAPAATTPTVTTQVADDLDFDFDEPATPSMASTPAVSTASPSTPNDTLSLDEFSFDEPATPVTSTASITSSPAVEAVEEFDFAMDDFDVTAPTPQAAVASIPTPTLETTHTPVPAPKVVEDFDFDFEEPPVPTVAATSKVTPSVAVTPVIASAQAQDSFDHDSLDTEAFNFDLDEGKTEPAVTETMLTPPVALLDDSKDMVFGLTEESRPATVQSVAPAPTPAADTAVSFDDDFNLDFDMPASPTVTDAVPTPVVTSPAVETVADTALFEFDETPTASAQSTIEPIKTESPTTTTALGDEYDTLNQLDDLYANPTIPAVAPAVITETQPATPAIMANSATTTAPVAMDENLLALVNGLDTAQLNLDLAAQYVQLGEYDSAKRLLTEINQANPQQQQQITALMDKIA